jgi:hypothetical protein
MKLFRLKSNPNTIVKNIGDGLCQIVWSSDYDRGFGTPWIYAWQPDNIIPLTEEECNEVEEKRKLRMGT